MKTPTVTLLTVFLSFIVTGCYSQCEYDNCSDCLDNSGCSWCFTTEKCVQGNSSGPDEGNCPSYSYTSCDIPVNCSIYTGCTNCTDISGCGWCASTMQCLNGGSDGPSSGSCSSWDWAGSNCDMNSCEAFTSCEECTDQNSCGWCLNTRTCQAGDSTGPYNEACSGVSWDYGGRKCYEGCQTWTDCESCTGVGGCGWCTNTSSCMAGDRSGDFGGNCGSTWDYNGRNCMEPIENFHCVKELASMLCPHQPDLITDVYTVQKFCTVEPCVHPKDCRGDFSSSLLCWNLCTKCHSEDDCNALVEAGKVAGKYSNKICAEDFSEFFAK